MRVYVYMCVLVVINFLINLYAYVCTCMYICVSW